MIAVLSLPLQMPFDFPNYLTRQLGKLVTFINSKPCNSEGVFRCPRGADVLSTEMKAIEDIALD